MMMQYIFLFLCLLVTVKFSASSNKISALELPESEYMALSDLYFDTDGMRWNWQKPYLIYGNPWTFENPVDPCTDSWQGVTCAINSGEYHVTELILDSLSIRGAIPHSICNLTGIRVFSLQDNALGGTIPSCIGTLKYLTEIALSGNKLHGSIPETLQQLPQLGMLNLDFNALTGTLDLLCDLQSLQELSANNNLLTGTIPECIGTLLLLTVFNIYRNPMNGTIPAILGNLTQLTQLYIGKLHLTGTIPSSLGNLSNLAILSLGFNNFTGTIPDTLGNLGRLNKIEIGSNRLSGTIPLSFGQLHHLKAIAIDGCFLTGALPSALTDIRILAYLELKYNYLTGSVPETVGNLHALEHISLGNNKMTGPFPGSLFNLTYLINMDLSYNQLTGPLLNDITFSINQTRALNYLLLSSNHLSGTIPSTIEYLAGVFQIDVANNLFHGTIPASIANIRTLAELDLSGNYLTGSIPETLRKVTGLAVLSLQGNQLNGNLNYIVSPSQELLTTIQLSNNQFTGELPAVLFELRSLISLSIVGSCLHGTLPSNICNATRLEALILQGLTTGASCQSGGIPSMTLQTTPQFEGSIPLCLLSMPRLRTLLLSSNGFTGPLDNNEAPLGVILSQLDLSHNLLHGAIPSNIQFHNWTVLDLSHNKLNGVLSLPLIMSALDVRVENSTDITFHPSLFLDRNRLSGPVPNSVKHMKSNLSILAGNLFQCRYDKTDLPQHDSDIDTYECASNSFDLSIYLWLGLTFCAAVFAIIYIQLRSTTSMVGLSEELHGMVYLADLFGVYGRLNKITGYCTLFCMLVLLPYYITVSYYYSTHTHTYAYVVSALYKSGIVPFVVTTVLLFLLLMVVVVYFFRKWQNLPYSDTPVIYPWRQLITIWFVFAFTNTAVVMGWNVLFVYIVLYQSSEAQTVAQIILSIFKLVWSMEVSPYMMRKLDDYYLPRESVQARKPRPNYFTLQLLVALFNNIAIPCLVVIAIDPNCFGDVLLPPGASIVDYLLPVCERNGLLNPCQFQSVEVTSIRFSPPFTYSYQCSASFITAYSPAFVYMSISNLLLHPTLQYVMLHVRRRAADPSTLHKLSSWALPRLLRPPTVEAYRKCLDSQNRSLVGASDVLVALFTQLGILLTFGAIFPPVALAMAVSIAAVAYQTRFKVLRFVQAVVDAQLLGYLDVINAECAGVGTREQMQIAVKIIVCYCCAFYTLFLFDTLGDSVGFVASVWILIVFPLTPIIVFAAYDMAFLYSLFTVKSDSKLPQTVIELKVMGIKEGVGDKCVDGSYLPSEYTLNPIHHRIM